MNSRPQPRLALAAWRVRVLLATFVLAGCSHVEPWQRGALARRDMQIAPDPQVQRLRDHVAVSKEGAQGGHEGGSGGCGCN